MFQKAEHVDLRRYFKALASSFQPCWKTNDEAMKPENWPFYITDGWFTEILQKPINLDQNGTQKLAGKIRK